MASLILGMREVSPGGTSWPFSVVAEGLGLWGRQSGVSLEEQGFAGTGVGQGELDAPHGVDDPGADLEQLETDGRGNPAPPAIAAPRAPTSTNERKSTTRRRMRVCVPVTGSPTSPTASVPRPSSRSRSEPHAQDRPPPVAPDLRLPVVTHGSVGAPGAAAVRQHALRHQRVDPVQPLDLLLGPLPPPATADMQPLRKRSHIKADARHLDMRKCILTGNVPRYRAM